MRILALLLLFLPVAAQADDHAQSVETIVNEHILPGFERFDSAATNLADTAADHCEPESEDLRAAWNEAFDAWLRISHLRFGPTETGDRGFALAFWPDTRGVTPKTLAKLIADGDPIAESPESYAEVSVAARGFYALEFLIYDPAISSAGDPVYHCTLIQTVTADIAEMARDMADEWNTVWAEQMLSPSADGLWHTDEEAARELFKALTTGLEFTADTRLGRPLGTFDRPRPARAEARRSGRSLRNVQQSLAALEDLALGFSLTDETLRASLESVFARSQKLAANLDDPVFAGVDQPQSRLRVEILQQSIGDIRDVVSQGVGPSLGIAAGFNSMDGD